MLPLIGVPRRVSIQEVGDVSLGSARRTSRGGSFNKELKELAESVPMRKSTVKIASNIKI